MGRGPNFTPNTPSCEPCKPRAPGVQVTRLDFLPEHAESYKQLVEVVERNLLNS